MSCSCLLGHKHLFGGYITISQHVTMDCDTAKFGTSGTFYDIWAVLQVNQTTVYDMLTSCCHQCDLCLYKLETDLFGDKSKHWHASG